MKSEDITPIKPCFRLIVNNKKNKPMYKVEPYHSELCYEIFEWRRVKHRDGSSSMQWQSMGFYPRSLKDACVFILKQKMIHDDSCKDAASIIQAIEDNTKTILKAIKKVEKCK